MSTTVTIYALTDSRIADPVRRVRYVGQTIRSLRRRLAIHWQTARAGEQTHRAAWMRRVAAVGGAVEIVHLETVCVADADRVESEQIIAWRGRGCDLTNATDGGGGVRGLRMSTEARKKMSAAASGRKPSLATRVRMSAAIRESHAAPAVRERLRHAQLGRTRSAGTRAKMSAARRGEGNGMARLSWTLVDVLRAQYASGARQCDLVRKFGVSAPLVHRVVHNRGWIW
jgi:hypothetical protein